LASVGQDIAWGLALRHARGATLLHLAGDHLELLL
jgi:hypothetical protein